MSPPDFTAAALAGPNGVRLAFQRLEEVARARGLRVELTVGQLLRAGGVEYRHLSALSVVRVKPQRDIAHRRLPGGIDRVELARIAAELAEDLAGRPA